MICRFGMGRCGIGKAQGRLKGRERNFHVMVCFGCPYGKKARRFRTTTVVLCLGSTKRRHQHAPLLPLPQPTTSHGLQLSFPILRKNKIGVFFIALKVKFIYKVLSPYTKLITHKFSIGLEDVRPSLELYVNYISHI